MRIVFKPTETAIPLSVKEELNTLIGTLKTNDDRVTLIAYASGMGEQASTSRRVSLSRALSVRAALIDQGISPLRINVLAEGDKNPSGEPDRVDVFVRKATDKK
jgi:outer membrane protein OmpA-like peptidoglycan-associated protein